MNGRRVVDIMYFIEQIQTQHGSGFGCSFMNCEFISETIYGFSSVFTFKCKMCGIETKLMTESPKTNKIPINKAVVSACQAIGIGHAQLSEFSAFLEMPSLSSSGFLGKQSEVANVVHDTAWDEMLKAGVEERELAIKCGDIDSDGVPMITVVADGQWSKRSYKTKYDALSGAVSKILQF